MTSSDAVAAVGVVLAGGASRRMGRDKARVRLGSGSLVERAAALLGEVVAEVVVADRGRESAPGYRSFSDGPGAGPAAGLLGAARVCPGRDLLVLACDLPAVTPALLRHLAGPVEEDVFVPRWRRDGKSSVLEPLCALYRPAALAMLAAEVDEGRFALHPLLRCERLQARFLEGSELAAFGPPDRLFVNVNTPADLARFDAREARGGRVRG